MQCCIDGFGILFGNNQQCTGRTIRFPPTLLPVLKCIDTYPDHTGKYILADVK